MKQSSTSVVVMSDAERRERLRNRIYAVFPVVSVLLLILLWFLAAGAENSTFPSPVDIWNRFLLLMEKPIKQLNLFGHIWASLLRSSFSFRSDNFNSCILSFIYSHPFTNQQF